jgi:hypothetical protein
MRKGFNKAIRFKLIIMKNLLIVVLIVLTSGLYGQTKVDPSKKAAPAVPVDTVIRFGNRKIPVVKLYIGTLTVTYALQSKPDSIIRLDQKEIEKIIYKNGAVRTMNKPVLEVIKNDQWQAILVTKDEKEVQGLYKRGFCRGKGNPTSSKKKAEESGIIKIQKQAAGYKATIVLITHEEYTGAYGEPAGYYVEGVAYGTEPLETGTNVVDPKIKNSKDKDSKTKK